jgi:hypothetical protein
LVFSCIKKNQAVICVCEQAKFHWNLVRLLSPVPLHLIAAHPPPHQVRGLFYNSTITRLLMHVISHLILFLYFDSFFLWQPINFIALVCCRNQRTVWKERNHCVRLNALSLQEVYLCYICIIITSPVFPHFPQSVNKFCWHF